jgi:polar amino acid transport system substrate-binding protein
MKLTRLAVVASLVAVFALAGCSKSDNAGGTITYGVDATYAPNEFKDDNGDPVGWDVELGTAIAKKLGKTAVFKIAVFDTIIPGVKGGKYDAGLSSFTDNAEREKEVDFVNYYQAGIQWATKIGTIVDPNNACGLTIAVQNGTYEVDDLKAKSKACTDAGKAPIQQLGFDAQDMATQAAVSGRAAAVTADSPIIQYAVKQNSSKLELIGTPYDSAPYGIAVAKDNTDLSKAIQKALQDLQADGTYASILDKWGVTAGAVDSITINQK